MPSPSPSGAAYSPAAGTDSGRPLTLGDRWAASATEQLERSQLIERARHTDAAAQLRRCCPSAARVLESLSWRALTRLAADEPVDPNDPDSWSSPDAHAQIVLRRHAISGLDSTRLTIDAVRALIDGQAGADRDAGVDWTRLGVPAGHLDAALRRAHVRLPIALDDPSIYAYRDDQRRALAGRLGVRGEQAGDLSRWLLAHPDAFDPDDLRCWRIASATWLALAGEQLPPVKEVERPVGPFLAPGERGEGWQLAPVLSSGGRGSLRAMSSTRDATPVGAPGRSRHTASTSKSHSSRASRQRRLGAAYANTATLRRGSRKRFGKSAASATQQGGHTACDVARS
jgi:hypothetical protein